jgi:glycerol-3-phosphate acyltransferase PlsY
MKLSQNPILFSLVVLPLLAAGLVLALLTLRDQPWPWQYAATLPLAYLLGSLPWGYVILQWRKGVDIREFGSGRIGTTNVLRTAGGRIAALVLALDLLKGVLAVTLAREVIGTYTAEVAAGLLVLVGHNWSIFLQFQGGRGIAPGLGGLLVMAPYAAIIGAATFIPVTLLSRYVSLGSIIGVVIACLSLLALAAFWSMYSTLYTIYAFIGGAIIIWQHRDNIERLLKGTERRIGVPAAKT